MDENQTDNDDIRCVTEVVTVQLDPFAPNTIRLSVGDEGSGEESFFVRLGAMAAKKLAYKLLEAGARTFGHDWHVAGVLWGSDEPFEGAEPPQEQPQIETDRGTGGN